MPDLIIARTPVIVRTKALVVATAVPTELFPVWGRFTSSPLLFLPFPFSGFIVYVSSKFPELSVILISYIPF